MIRLLRAGVLTTLQDQGRRYCARQGVGDSGAVDQNSHALANRLVGNGPNAGTVEMLNGSAAFEFADDYVVALTGAAAQASLDGADVGANWRLHVRRGQKLVLGAPVTGLYTYLAVRGGFRGQAVFGSIATDTLSGLGPAPLAAGDLLEVGDTVEPLPAIDYAPVPPITGDDTTLRAILGPRDDWFTADAVRALTSAAWEVSSLSNRVGLRLRGPVLERSIPGELLSEGVALGALQVSADGQPTLFLADHPITGGYPVIAVVVADDIPRAAQARPGQRLRFSPA